MTRYHYRDAIVHCLTFIPLPCPHWHLCPHYVIPMLVLVREFFLEGGSTWGPTLCPSDVVVGRCCAAQAASTTTPHPKDPKYNTPIQ